MTVRCEESSQVLLYEFNIYSAIYAGASNSFGRLLSNVQVGLNNAARIKMTFRRPVMLMGIAGVLLSVGVIVIAFKKSSTRGPSFQEVNQWTSAETATLKKLPATWQPSDYQLFRAEWSSEGITNFVYLERVGVQSISEPYRVFVFDSKGTLLQHSEIGIYTGYEPRFLLSVTPVRVAFGIPGAKVADRVREAATPSIWQQRTQQVNELIHRRLGVK